MDVLLVYQAANGDLVKAAVDLGAQGLVIATAGAGAISGTQGDGIRHVLAQGRPVVYTTRAGAGRIAADTASAGTASAAGDAIFRIAGEDHTPLKARVLLMLALAAGLQPADIQRVFIEY